MRLSAISNRGLLVISMLVMVLWGIIVAERVIVREAQREHYEFLRTKPAVVPTDPRPEAPQRPSRPPARKIQPV